MSAPFDAKQQAREWLSDSGWHWDQSRVQHLAALLAAVRDEALEEAQTKVRNGVSAASIKKRIRALKSKGEVSP